MSEKVENKKAAIMSGKTRKKIRAPALPHEGDAKEGITKRSVELDEAFVRLRYGIGEGMPRAWIYPDLPWGAFDHFPEGYLRGQYYLLWEIIALGLVMYIVIDTPYILAFGDPKACFTGSKLVWDIAVIAFFVFDIVLQFNCARFVFSDDGTNAWWLLDHLPVIYKKYASCMSWRGQSLFWDVLGMLPWNHFLCLAGMSTWATGLISDGDRVLFGFRLIQLTKFWRLWRLKQLYKRLSVSHRWTLQCVDVLMVLWWIYYMSHLAACMWFGLGSRPDGWTTLSGWLYGEPDDEKRNFVASLYWSIMTVTTVGYGDIHPVSDDERIFAIFAMVGSAILTAWVTASMTGTVLRSTAARGRFLDFMGHVQHLADSRNLPKDIRNNMLKYYESLYPTQYILDDSSIIDPLPVGVQKNIAAHSYSRCVGMCPLFRTCSEETQAEACFLFERRTFNAGLDVTTADSEPDACYIVLSGTVLLTAQKTAQGVKQWVRLPDAVRGSMFGELALLGMLPNGRRLRSARTATDCELLQLSKGNLKKLILEHGDIRRRYTHMVSNHLRRLSWEGAKFNSGLANDTILLLALNNWMYHMKENVVVDYAALSRCLQEKTTKRNRARIPQTIQTAVQVNPRQVKGLRMFTNRKAIVCMVVSIEWEGQVAFSKELTYMQDYNFDGSCTPDMGPAVVKLSHLTTNAARNMKNPRLTLHLKRYRMCATTPSKPAPNKIRPRGEYSDDEDDSEDGLDHEMPQEAGGIPCSAHYDKEMGVWRCGTKPKEGEQDLDPALVLRGVEQPLSSEAMYSEDGIYPVIGSAILGLKQVMEGIEGTVELNSSCFDGLTISLTTSVWRILAADSLFKTEVFNIVSRVKHMRKMNGIVAQLRRGAINVITTGESASSLKIVNSKAQQQQRAMDKIASTMGQIQKSLDFTQEMMARVEKRLERVEKRQVKEHSALDEATGHLEGSALDIEEFFKTAETRTFQREKQLLDTVTATAQQVMALSRKLDHDDSWQPSVPQGRKRAASSYQIVPRRSPSPVKAVEDVLPMQCTPTIVAAGSDLSSQLDDVQVRVQRGVAPASVKSPPYPHSSLSILSTGDRYCPPSAHIASTTPAAISFRDPATVVHPPAHSHPRDSRDAIRDHMPQANDVRIRADIGFDNRTQRAASPTGSHGASTDNILMTNPLAVSSFAGRRGGGHPTVSVARDVAEAVVETPRMGTPRVSARREDGGFPIKRK